MGPTTTNFGKVITDAVSGLFHHKEKPPDEVAADVKQHVQGDEAVLTNSVAIDVAALGQMKIQYREALQTADGWHKKALDAQTDEAATVALQQEAAARRLAATLKSQIDQRSAGVQQSRDNLETAHLETVATDSRADDLANRHHVAQADEQLHRTLDKASDKLDAAEHQVNHEEAGAELRDRMGGELDRIAHQNDVAAALEKLKAERAARADQPPQSSDGWNIAH